MQGLVTGIIRSLTRYHQAWLFLATASGGLDPERWVWGKEGLSCQTSQASERRLLTKAHPLVQKEVVLFFVFLLLFNFLLAGQVLLNIKVSTIGGNYTVSCFN